MSLEQANDLLKSFTEENVRNPSENLTSPNTYDCEFLTKRDGWVPFTADPNDTTGYGREVYRGILAGYAGEISPVDPELKWTNERDNLISKSSLGNQDYDELTDTQKQELSTFRSTVKNAEYPDELPDLLEWL